MSDDPDMRDPREWMADLASRMADLEQEMVRLLATLPDDAPAAMLEGQEPYDVNLELRSTLECALEDSVRPVIAQLQAASRVTAEQLRREWEEGTALRPQD